MCFSNVQPTTYALHIPDRTNLWNAAEPLPRRSLKSRRKLKGNGWQKKTWKNWTSLSSFDSLTWFVWEFWWTQFYSMMCVFFFEWTNLMRTKIQGVIRYCEARPHLTRTHAWFTGELLKRLNNLSNEKFAKTLIGTGCNCHLLSNHQMSSHVHALRVSKGCASIDGLPTSSGACRMSKYGVGKMYWTEVRLRGSLKTLGRFQIYNKLTCV